jgi:O-antigen ligase
VSGPWIRPQQGAATLGWFSVSLLLVAVLLSIALSPQINWVAQAILAAFCLLAFSSPSSALLVTTAVVGMGGIFSVWMGVPPLRTVEFMLVASLAGCYIRAIPPNTAFRRAVGAELSAPLVLLSGAALASALVWLRVHQVQTTYPSSYLEALLQFLVRDFFLASGEFRLIVTTAALLEGLGLYLAMAALCRVDPTFFGKALRMLVIGGAGLGLLSVYRLAEVQIRNPEAIQFLRTTAAGLRISPQIPDYIAAGSYFIVCWLAALGLALDSPRRRLFWLAASVPLIAGTYLTGSRSVIGAALVGVVVLLVLTVRQRVVMGRHVAALAFVAIAAMIVSYPWLTGRDVVGETAAISLKTRVELAKTSMAVIGTRPLFGIGFDRFQHLADDFASPELDALWHGRKNPHNDFLRVGAELGLIGLGLLLWLLGSAARRIGTGLRQLRDVRLAALAGALTAFAVTSLISDPLMVREVSYVFWIVLGLAVGHSAGPLAAPGSGPWASRSRPWTPAIAVLLGAAVTVSIPFRARQELRGIDLQHVTYGLSEWVVDEDGTPNRWSGPRATLFVDGRARLVELPLSSTLPGGAPQQVEVRVDGRLANRLEVGSEWQPLRLTLPTTGSSTPKRIDLLVAPTWIPADVIHNDDHRVLGVKVGGIHVVRGPREDR